jgi:hypothetical protein
MKRICAWCKIDMGTKLIDANFENTVTHGICPACLETNFQLRQSSLIDILDRLDTPVIVIDSTMCVCSANKQAQALLQKKLPDIVGVVAGEMLECVYSKLTGGCGNTTHCDGCMIRNTVTDTFQTGKSHLKIPAHLLQGTPDNNQEINLLLSTEKVKDVVLLRVNIN